MMERLKASLELDTSGFRSGVNDAQDDLDGFANRASDIGSSMQSVGAKMSLGITAPLTGAAAMSLSTASDVEETQGKMSAVYGDLTDDVNEWADEHGDAIGRSQHQLAEMATGFQDTLVPLGMARDEATDMSTDLAELSSDLASFNNVADDDAARKLESALVGNHQAVRDFGIVLTQDRLDQKLEEMYDVGVQGANEQQKAQARMNLIMEDSSDAIGDAERTSDSFANQQRRLKGRIEELRAEIGKHLLPVAQTLIQNVSGLVDVFGNLSDTQQRIIIAISGVLAVIGPLLVVLGTAATLAPTVAAGFGILAGAVGALSLPILAVVAAVALLAAAFYKDVGGIRTFTENAFSAIQDAIEPAIDFLKENIPPTLSDIRSAFETAFEAVQDAVEPVMEWLTELHAEYIQPLESDFRETWDVVQGRIERFAEWVRPYLETLMGGIRTMIEIYLTPIRLLWERFGDSIMEVVRFAFNTIRTVIEGAIDTITTVISVALAVIRGDWETVFEEITGLVSRQFERIKGIFEDYVDTLKQVAGDIIDGVIGVFEDLYERLIGNSIIPNMLSDIIAAVSDFDLSGAFDEAVSAALEIVEGMASRFKEAGAGLISSLSDGIRDNIPDVKGAAEDAADEIRGLLPSSDAEEGPLSDLTDSGKALPETLAKGMEANAGAVNGPAGEVAGNAKPRVGQTGSGSGGSGLDGMAIELMGTLDVSGDVATLDDVDARLRRVKRQADNRGVRR